MNAIITGASKGIGRAIAFSLAEMGYNLNLAARNLKDLELLAQELLQFEVELHCHVVDFSDVSATKAFAELMQSQSQPVQVLVNNVGAFMPHALLDEPDENFHNQQNINVNAAYYMSKYIGRKMRHQRQGHIFNVCSVASKTYVEHAGTYSVTKAALLSLNNVLRQELAAYQVKVTALIPGSTLTASWAGTEIAAEKFVQAADISKAMAFALSVSAGANVDEITITPQYF